MPIPLPTQLAYASWRLSLLEIFTLRWSRRFSLKRRMNSTSFRPLVSSNVNAFVGTLDEARPISNAALSVRFR
jgi:hypothetical protein